MVDPPRDALGLQRLRSHGGSTTYEVRIRVLPGAHYEDEGGRGVGVREIPVELIPHFGFALPQLIDAAQHNRAAFREHRRSVDQVVEGFRRQVGSVTGVEVEIARGDGDIDDRTNGFILEDVFIPVEQVDRRQRTRGTFFFETAKKGIKGERRHIGEVTAPYTLEKGRKTR